VVSFGKLAEICSQILTRGTKLFISGRLQNRQVVKPGGEKFRKTEIVARNVLAFANRKQSLNSRNEN
jgi:single-stranded DNA-binding protein